MLNKEEIIERLNRIINMMNFKADQYRDIACKGNRMEDCLVTLWLDYYCFNIRTLIEELKEEASK